MDDIEKIITIAYGTETNTAFDLAYHCYSQLKVQGVRFVKLDESFVFTEICLFFISTTGQGDMPYHMRELWNKIMQKTHACLNGVQFAVMGLGDRGYGDNFNLCGRKFRQRLLMLEAEEIGEICLGDDQDAGGCWQVYQEQYLPKILKYLNHFKKISYQTHEHNLLSLRLNNKPSSFYQPFQITKSSQLHQFKDREVFWVTLKAPIQQNTIELGDILSIYPQNKKKVVEKMLKYFLENNVGKFEPFDCEDQLRDYLQKQANLENTLNYTFFTLQPSLSSYINPQTPPEILSLFQQKLKEISSSYQEYFHYIKKFRRNVIQVIQDFNLKLPIKEFVKRVMVISSRKYSIAQIGVDEHSDQIGLLVKLEKYQISSNRVVKGLCSYDLAGMQEEGVSKMRMGKILKNGQFAIDLLSPSDTAQKRTIITISLGIGIAPFLSIFQQIKYYQFSPQEIQIIMFHSARYQQQLPQYENILNPLQQSQLLRAYITYTRQKQNNKRLQFLIKEQLEENSEQYFEILENGNNKLMLCGNKQFCQVIERMVEESLKVNVKELKRKKILCIQTW